MEACKDGQLENTGGSSTTDTSDYLVEVVQGLKNQQEFKLAGEVQRVLG